MEKIILVIYLSVEGMCEEERKNRLEKVKHELVSAFDKNVHFIFVPINEGETKIDCINPKLISEEEYKSVKAIKALYSSLLEKML